MPNYLVELNGGGFQLAGGHDRMVIFAADAAGARRAAAGRYDGDSSALWNTVATVTELVAGTQLSDAGIDGWTAYARISGGTGQTIDPKIVTVDGQTNDPVRGILGADRLHLTGALNSGGTATYVIDDILTASGGTFTRAATFRVITVSTGVITALELVDPGEYSVLPATMTANPVTGGGGTNATVDLTQAEVGGYEALIAQLVTDLSLDADFTSSVDFSEGASGARLLTLATVGDNSGDATVELEIRHNGTAETALVGAITDGGIAGAVLTAAIPASPLAPPRVHAFKS